MTALVTLGLMFAFLIVFSICVSATELRRRDRINGLGKSGGQR
jgi:hypothetical protein